MTNLTGLVRTKGRAESAAVSAVSRVWRFVGAPFALLFRHRVMLYQTVSSDVRSRYAGSILGLAWLVIYPLLFLGAYSLVYIYIFNVRFGLYGSHEYVLHIFCGLVPFLAFAESLAAGVPSVTSNSNLIRNSMFPIELVPVKTVIASQCTHLAATGILLGALGVCGRLTVYAALLPVLLAAQVLLSMGLIWILSSLNVYIRDLQNAVAIATLILMLVSPIAYSVSDLPSGIGRLLLLNPLFYIVVSWQQILMEGRVPVGTLVSLGVISLLFASFGLFFFNRMKKVFADNV